MAGAVSAWQLAADEDSDPEVRSLVRAHLAGEANNDHE